MTAPTPKQGIMDIAPYVGGESGVEGQQKIIKLSSNEGALGPSPMALAAYKAEADDVHRYPEGGCQVLRNGIGNIYGLDPDRIVCGAGSDELISLLCHAYAGPGDEVLYSQHGFLMYPIAAKSEGATPVKAPETNLKTDVDAMLAAVTDKTRIVFIANPNNPTGSYLASDEMTALRNGLRDDILLVIDGAYAEFVTANDYSPGIDLVDSHDNVVMTRTFSKIYALGGLRLGWCYCPPAIADVLNRVRGPFNVSSAAQAAGLAAIQDIDFVDKVRNHTEQCRNWTVEQVKALGYSVAPSVTNFILIHLPEEDGKDAAACDAFMKSKGIIIRRMGGYDLPASIRVTIGNEDEMQAFIAALTEFADKA